MGGANRDLIGECNEQGASPQEFQEMFCQRCKNPECYRAAWGDSLFSQRVATQADRLLHNPRFADPNDSKYDNIRALHFKDMIEQAMRLEIADRRGDWQVPEINITDGRQQVAPLDTTRVVDDAVRRLATAQGKKPPALADPLLDSPDVPVSQGEPLPTPLPPAAQSPPRPMTPINTPVSAGGIMVGSASPYRMQVEPEPSRIPGREVAAEVQADPWAAPDRPPDQVVDPGATIRLAFAKADEEEGE